MLHPIEACKSFHTAMRPGVAPSSWRIKTQNGAKTRKHRQLVTSLWSGPLADVANVKMGDWPRIGANVGEVTVSLPEVHNGEWCAAQVTIFGVRGANQRRFTRPVTKWKFASFPGLGRNTLTNKDNVWICPSDQSNLGLDSTNQGF